MTDKAQSVAIVGLGYVGLPLALLAAEKGYDVHGIDIDKNKLASLEANTSYIDDISDEMISNTSATFTDDFSVIEKVSSVIICVPTPVTSDKQPDLTPVKSSVKAVIPHLQPGSLLVLESTVNPGVCDDVIIPLIEQNSTLKVDQDVFLAHCPERINPGDPKWNVSNINRVVGANSPESLDKAIELYETLIDATIKPMGSLKEAEAVKVVENSFRDINIAFVNELAMSFSKMGIDVVNVIDGAATKPFAFMPHYPGAGVGGHCIPVDPYYLIEYANTYGFEHRFLRLARDINEGMPEHTVSLLTDVYANLEDALEDATVAVLGLSYKSNIGDDRESPAYEIRDLLAQSVKEVRTFDPYILENSSVDSIEKALEGADAVVLATGHNEFTSLDPATLKAAGIKAFIDGRNSLKSKKADFKKAGVEYRGIGL